MTLYDVSVINLGSYLLDANFKHYNVYALYFIISSIIDTYHSLQMCNRRPHRLTHTFLRTFVQGNNFTVYVVFKNKLTATRKHNDPCWPFLILDPYQENIKPSGEHQNPIHACLDTTVKTVLTKPPTLCVRNRQKIGLYRLH